MWVYNWGIHWRDNGFMQCGALDFSRLIAKGGNSGGLSHSGK